MRICFLNHSLAAGTGAGNFGLMLAKYLRRARPDIDFVFLTSVGCGHPLERAILPSKRFGLLKSWLEIRRAFRNCDVIHALDGYPHGVIAALVSLGLGKKLVITAIGTGAVQPLYRRHGWFVVWAYRRADCLIAVSDYTRREILKKVPGLNIEVINHGVEAEEFSGDVLGALTLEERQTIARLKPYILSVGAWKKRKGYEYSFPAFAAVAKKFPELNYAVCGAAGKKAFAERWGIGKSVFFFQGVSWPFLKALYREAKLFMLLPYDAAKDVEGFGFAFLEAAATGLPVIGTYASGAEDAVRDGGNGFLVEPRSAAAAAEAALKILDSPELEQKFRKGSLSFAREMNWPQVAAKYSAIYSRLEG